MRRRVLPLPGPKVWIEYTGFVEHIDRYIVKLACSSSNRTSCWSKKGVRSFFPLKIHSSTKGTSWPNTLRTGKRKARLPPRHEICRSANHSISWSLIEGWWTADELFWFSEGSEAENELIIQYFTKFTYLYPQHCNDLKEILGCKNSRSEMIAKL